MSDESNEVEVTTPAGKLRARGTDIISTILAIGVAVVAYAMWEHRIDAKADAVVIAKTLEVAQAEQLQALRSVAESQAELSYLMSLTPEQRSKLNLEMPDTLRKRLRNR
jgi:hypothetical protein